MNKKTADLYEVKKQVCSATGFVYKEFHLKNGVLHREDGPARIVRTPHDDEFREYHQVEEWYLYGQQARLDDGPAQVIKEMPHEHIVGRLYFDNGKPGPSPYPELDH